MKRKKIRISQCMIVKNEEKNIRRALSWAKDIVFEQIVVDTGSTDRTVEIAREMGAKIPLFVRCAWIQLGDNGKPFSVDPQDRIFRNRERMNISVPAVSGIPSENSRGSDG